MTISDIIALLAFFLSIYGAVISTLLALESNLKIKLEYLDDSFLTLSGKNETINNFGELFTGYNKDAFTIGIKVRIINKSKSPTTINEFILNKKYILNSSSNIDFSLIPTSFENCGTTLIYHTAKSMKKESITPLIEMKPLSSMEGYIIFSQLKEIPKTFNIKIITVQKSKTFNLKFNITSDYRNEIV